MGEKMERIMIANLRRAYEKPRTKRRAVVMKLLREIVARHMKVNYDDVKIDNAVTKKIYERGSRFPLRKIKIKVVKDEKTGIAIVMLPEESMKDDGKKEKEKEKEGTKQEKKEN